MHFGDDMKRCEICNNNKLVLTITFSTAQSGDVQKTVLCLKHALPIIEYVAISHKRTAFYPSRRLYSDIIEKFYGDKEEVGSEGSS